MNFYSIKDKHIGCFTPPFMAMSDLDAKRMIADSIDSGSVLSKYPEDFILCKVGKFDEASGILSGDMEFICSMNDIIRYRTVTEMKTEV